MTDFCLISVVCETRVFLSVFFWGSLSDFSGEGFLIASVSSSAFVYEKIDFQNFQVIRPKKV